MLQMNLQSTFKQRLEGFILLLHSTSRVRSRWFGSTFEELLCRTSLRPDHCVTLMWYSTFHSSQIHLVCELRLWSALHPERGSAAVRPGPRALSADHRGYTPQHLAPLQDSARIPAPPSAAELQEHNYHLPQEDQCHLHHRAELRQPPDSQTVPLQCGAGGHRQAFFPCGSFSVAPRGWLRWSAVFYF